MYDLYIDICVCVCYVMIYNLLYLFIYHFSGILYLFSASLMTSTLVHNDNYEACIYCAITIEHSDSSISYSGLELEIFEDVRTIRISKSSFKLLEISWIRYDRLYEKIQTVRHSSSNIGYYEMQTV